MVVRERYARLSYQCSPYHSNSALRPFITNLERRTGFKADDVQATPRQVGSGPCCAGSRIEAVAPLFAARCRSRSGAVSAAGAQPHATAPPVARRLGWQPEFAGTGRHNGPSGTTMCACSNAVPCRPWAFFTDSLCAARGRRRWAGERRGGWGGAGEASDGGAGPDLRSPTELRIGPG